MDSIKPSIFQDFVEGDLLRISTDSTIVMTETITHQRVLHRSAPLL